MHIGDGRKKAEREATLLAKCSIFANVSQIIVVGGISDKSFVISQAALLITKMIQGIQDYPLEHLRDAG